MRELVRTFGVGRDVEVAVGRRVEHLLEVAGGAGDAPDDADEEVARVVDLVGEFAIRTPSATSA